MPQIVFLTLFLGLTSGPGSIALQVDSAVKSVRIELGGRELVTLQQPPWSANVDFGEEIRPQELVAIGYDAHGQEIARASQLLNVPRPAAELEIHVLTEHGEPTAATVVARNTTHSPVASWEVRIDGNLARVEGDMRVMIPELNWSHPHVLSAIVQFENGQIARRESVVQGGIGEAVSSEVTPVLVTRTTRRDPAALDGCFSLAGLPLRATTLERNKPLVILVKEPDTTEVLAKLQPTAVPRSGTWWEAPKFRAENEIERDATQQVMWPVAVEYKSPEEPTYSLFPFSNEIPATKAGMSWLLTRPFSHTAASVASKPRRFADAAAVAGLMTLESGRRRAVVLLLSAVRDSSTHSPLVIRRYLDRIGVPLFVWSLDGPRPDLVESWGEIEDISSRRGLSRAVGKLNDALREQRIAWISVDALGSLRVEASDRCGLLPAAHSH